MDPDLRVSEADEVSEDAASLVYISDSVSPIEEKGPLAESGPIDSNTPYKRDGGGDISRSLDRNLWKLGAGRALVKMSATCSEDRVVSEVNCRQVITKNHGCCFAGLSEFMKLVLDPLQLSEDGSESSILGLGGASTTFGCFEHFQETRLLPK
ncbi:hypothetical protein PIB30_035988 [Stylosanthes scabra]|uniref:Uncharacterized protein n=1 Tax=Stylosanthes scabra TaxID=79078 RepID=A0ABU6TD05_9FABA|nr:hypothetical protein [Stylosanthes scabra]